MRWMPYLSIPLVFDRTETLCGDFDLVRINRREILLTTIFEFKQDEHAFLSCKYNSRSSSLMFMFSVCSISL